MSFTQPWVLALLLLALVGLWRAVTPGAPRSEWLGTLRLWPEEGAEGAASRRRPPWARIALLLALVAATLAAAGLSRIQEEQRAHWDVIVDRSGSMALPGPGGEARWREALEQLSDGMAPGADLTFVAGDDPTLSSEGDAPPEEWFDGAFRPAPAWDRFDRVGALWLTDVVSLTPTTAGLVASGGSVTPGVISRDGGGGLALGPEGVAACAGTPSEVSLDPALPPLLRAAVLAWAEARGHRIVSEAEGTALAVTVAEGAGSTPLRWEGSSWRVVGMGRAAPGVTTSTSVEGPLSTGPGWLRLGIARVDRIEGDAARFALDLAAVLDGALAPPGVVPLEERLQEGPPRTKLGHVPVPRTAGPDSLLGLLASIAAGLAVLAWLLAGPGRP